MVMTDNESWELSLLERDEFLCFESFELDLDTKCVTFTFHFCGGRRFRSRLQLNGVMADWIDDDNTHQLRLPRTALDNVLLHIGLCILPWYWMGYNCRVIRIDAGYLTTDQVAFWQELYQQVLLEFLFVHQVDRDRLIIEVNGAQKNYMISEIPKGLTLDLVHRKQVTASPDKRLPVLKARKLPQNRILVPLGGGKDSLVVYHLLESSPWPCGWLHVGDHQGEFNNNARLQEIVNSSWQAPTDSTEFKRFLSMEHWFDDQIWENEVAGTRYSPCGHPWAALVAFDAVLACLAGDYNYIAVGNERSANEGNNVWYQGLDVNHQYDKSFAFEQQVHDYIRQYLVQDLWYFSALQHLWEIQIARQFWDFGRWLHQFISCNETNQLSWCGKCAKCAFVFVLLSAWSDPPTKVCQIFDGRNLLDDEQVFDHLDALWRPDRKLKPMECVGTRQETHLASFLALQKYQTWYATNKNHAMVPEYLRRHAHAIETANALLALLDDYNGNNLIPTTLLPYLCKPIRTFQNDP